MPRASSRILPTLGDEDGDAKAQLPRVHGCGVGEAWYVICALFPFIITTPTRTGKYYQSTS